MTHQATDGNLNRRGFLRGLVVATLGAIAGGVVLFRDRLPGILGPRRRPNIIFIIADDLGYGDLGSYGQQLIQTPHLDAMAAEGMRFTQCYAGSTVCMPSRATLMTGLHTGHARIRANRSVKAKRVALRPQDLTVAELLKSAGYTTGGFGKWGLGGVRSEGPPHKKGFDEWFGYLSQSNAHEYYPEFLWRNGEQVWIEENFDGKKEVYSHDLITSEALSFIQAHQEDRFFLYLPYTIPHPRLEPPSDEPYADKPWPQEEKSRSAMITRMDRDVGRILSLLKELRLDKDTIVFFTSDNGPARSDTEIGAALFRRFGPLSGSKGKLYEGGIRVPMLVWWPGVIEPGTVSEHVWAFWDFMLTAADLAETELPEDVETDGISVLPTLLGETQQEHEYLYWEYFNGLATGDFLQAVRMGDWKGVRNAADADIELYDLRDDISEEHDLAAEHPEIVAEIADIMQTAHTPSDNWGGP